MNTFAEILKFTIPSVITGGIIYLLFRSYHQNAQKMALLSMKQDNGKELLPVKLQAYERLVLFLERIAVNNLVIRVSRPGMNARGLQQALISAVRDEFDHNLSQQLYISDQSWELVVNAKEEMLRAINASASSLGEEADATELAAVLLSNILKDGHSPVDVALFHLKNEMREQF